MTGGAQDAILDGAMLVALPIAFLAGLLSFFTPCSLPLVPGYLSYVAGMAGTESEVTRELGGGAPARRSRTMMGAFLFVLGFAVVFTSYGMVFGSLGAQLLVRQDTIVRVAGVLTIGLGILFTGVAGRLPVLGKTVRLGITPGVGLAGAPLLGAVFAIGWTPCMGPALAAVLTLATTTATAGRGALLSLGYAIGLGIPFLLAAMSLTRSMRVFSWVRERSVLITRGGGALLIVVGLLQVSGFWSQGVAALQTLITGWQAPL